MKHFLLIAALGEIFYGVVSGQNLYNNDPNTNYGNFQSIPVLNQNEESFGQNFPPNGFEPQPSVEDGFQNKWFQQQQPSFQQPSAPYLPLNAERRPYSQPQNYFQRQYDGGYNLPWNVPFQANRNSQAEQIGYNPSQSTFGSNIQPPDQATYGRSPQNSGYRQVSNQETEPSPGFNAGRRRRLRRRRRRRRKNGQERIGDDQSPGTGASSFSNQDGSYSQAGAKSSNTDEQVPADMPNRQERIGDDQSPGTGASSFSNQEGSYSQAEAESSNTDEQVPADMPNDYPGYTYPPWFFGDMLKGLDDSNDESNPQTPGMDQSDYSNAGSSDNNNPSDANASSNNDQVPPGVPNDYPGMTYPPGFFPDMMRGLDDSTMATDYEDFSPDTMGYVDNSTMTTDDGGTCPENEEATDCMSPCNTCAANCQNCQFKKCEEGCDCLDGFKRNSKGDCVHASQCPPCAAPSSTAKASASN